jgi:osmotically-inducible protein OsmY
MNAYMNHFRRPMAVLLMAGLLNGCTALAVGGAAAGSYYVVKDERTLSEITSDARITSSVNLKFLSDDLVNPMDINVDTYLGVVTLKGTVDDPVVARRAYDLAYSVDGVYQVISELAIRTVPMTPWGPVDR